MRIISKNIKIDKLMEDKKDIFEYINLYEIKKLLINQPQLCVLFEILCLHINNLIN